MDGPVGRVTAILEYAFTGLGIAAKVRELHVPHLAADLVIELPGFSREWLVDVRGQITSEQGRALMALADDKRATKIYAADRISADARAAMSAAGANWIDLRGHVHLTGQALLIDTDFTPLLIDQAALMSKAAIRGGGGMAVAYWLSANPDRVMSPTHQGAELGLAPSSVHAAIVNLVEAGLCDRQRRGVQPELFYELAGVWPTQWTWLAQLPEPARHADAEGRTQWVRTGDAVAAALGAPIVNLGTPTLDLLAPGPVDLTIAQRTYGVGAPGGPARIAVSPVRQIMRDAEPRGGDWSIASELGVALWLATDRSRGRQILDEWPGSHVWK